MGENKRLKIFNGIKFYLHKCGILEENICKIPNLAYKIDISSDIKTL